jgi:hypothetical protein
MVRLKTNVGEGVAAQAFGAAALPESSGSSTLLCGTRQRRAKKG